MTKITPNKPKLWQRFVLTALVVLAVFVVTDSLANLVVYPTEGHRATAGELSKIQSEIGLNYDSSQPELLAKEAAVAAQPESVYSTIAGIVASLVSFAIWVLTTWKVYRSARRTRLTARYRLFTFGAVMLPSILSTYISLQLTISQIGDAGFSGIGATGALIGAIIFGSLFTLLLIMIIDKIYNSRNSLVVE